MSILAVSNLGRQQGPVLEVCLLVVHRYPSGVRKLVTAPKAVEFLCRRGKPVKEKGLIPEDNELRPFLWWPRLNQFELRATILQVRPLG